MTRTFLTTKEAAKILGLSRQQVNNLIHGGWLKTERAGRDWLIPASEVTAERKRRVAAIMEAEK